MVRESRRVAVAGRWLSSAALAVLVSACSSPEGRSDEIEPVVDVDATTTALVDESAPTTSSVSTAEDADLAAEVEAAYRAAWAGFQNAAVAGDPDSAELTQGMFGEALDDARDWVADRVLLGESVSFPQPGHSRIDVISVQSRSEGRAVVVACIVDDAVVVQSASGAIVNDRVSIAVVSETMNRTEGSWKLVSRETLSEGETPQCAL